MEHTASQREMRREVGPESFFRLGMGWGKQKVVKHTNAASKEISPTQLRKPVKTFDPSLREGSMLIQVGVVMLGGGEECYENVCMSGW